MHLAKISKAPILPLVLFSFQLSFLCAQDSWHISFQFMEVAGAAGVSNVCLCLFSDTHLAEFLTFVCIIKLDLPLGLTVMDSVSSLVTSPRL